MALEIREESVESTRVLVLSGRLDTDTSADFELAVQDLLQAGERQFVVDLGGVGYVSSAGLRVLLMLGKAVDGKGGLRLAALNPTVRQVFDVAGFTQLFAIFPDRASALGSKSAKSDSSGLAEAAARLLGANSERATGTVDAEIVASAARLLGADRIVSKN